MTPQGMALQMMEDVNTGISWVLRNIGDHGGDTSRVFLVGHSAGAHLGSLTLFRQVSFKASRRA